MSNTISAITFGFPGVSGVLWDSRTRNPARCTPGSVHQALAIYLAADTGLVSDQRLFLNALPVELDWGLVLSALTELPENDLRFRRFRVTLAGRHTDHAALRELFAKVTRHLPLIDWAAVRISDSQTVLFAELFTPTGTRSEIRCDGGIDKLHVSLDLELLVLC